MHCNIWPCTYIDHWWMQARGDTISNFGRPSPIVSTVFQSLRSSTRKSSPCTGVWVLICRVWNRSDGSWGQQMCLIRVRAHISFPFQNVHISSQTYHPYLISVLNIVVWFVYVVGLLCDLLWSDPDKDITGWSENDRGVSFTFGPDVVTRFLQKHDMDLICRAHQVVEDGYEFFAKRQLVTLFSAPNYCGEFDNAGAMMSVDETLLCSFQVGRLTSQNRLLSVRPPCPSQWLLSDPYWLPPPPSIIRLSIHLASYPLSFCYPRHNRSWNQQKRNRNLCMRAWIQVDRSPLRENRRRRMASRHERRPLVANTSYAGFYFIWKFIICVTMNDWPFFFWLFPSGSFLSRLHLTTPLSLTNLITALKTMSTAARLRHEVRHSFPFLLHLVISRLWLSFPIISSDCLVVGAKGRCWSWVCVCLSSVDFFVCFCVIGSLLSLRVMTMKTMINSALG